MTCAVGVVLAAGPSNRLGRPKQLVQVRGEPLVRRTTWRLLESSCDRVAVVLGAFRDRVERALDGLPVARVVNDAWSEGMASSIRAGLRWARGCGAEAVLLSVCDQARLTAGHLDCLLRVWRTRRTTVASRYEGVLGTPAVFDGSVFGALSKLEGGRGAHALLEGALAVDWPDGAVDVDTAADLARLP